MKCRHCGEYAPDTNYKCPHCGKVLKEDFDPTALKRDAVKKSRPIISPILIIISLGLIIFLYIKFQPFSSKTEPTPQNKTLKLKPVASKKTPSAPTKKETKVANVNENKDNSDIDTSQEQPVETSVDDPVLDEQTEDLYSENDGESVETSSGDHVPGERVDLEQLVEIGKTTIFDFYSDYCPPCKKISPLLTKLDQKRRDIIVIKIDINRKGIKTIDWQSPVARQYELKGIPHFKIYDVQGLLSLEGDPAYERILQLLSQEGIIQ
jgi:thiol-disulfide isomerase/thioredoxin